MMRYLRWPPRRDPHAWDDLVVMLTASIKPNTRLVEEVVGTAKTREADYARCMAFFLESLPRLRALVFVDNSGWELGEIQRVADHHARPGLDIELVSFDANGFPGELGKGWGEGELIRQALNESRLLRSTPRFAKMTGRHLLRNLADIVERTSHGYDMVCDLRDHPLYELLRLPGAGRKFDSRFFICRRQFYEAHYRDLHLTFREPGSQGYYIEAGFYAVTKSLEPSSRILDRFPVEPVYGGLAGHGKDYDGVRERVKRAVRGTTRVIAPWLKV